MARFLCDTIPWKLQRTSAQHPGYDLRRSWGDLVAAPCETRPGFVIPLPIREYQGPLSGEEASRVSEIGLSNLLRMVSINTPLTLGERELRGLLDCWDYLLGDLL